MNMNNNVNQNTTTTTTYTGVVYSYTNTTAGDEYGYRYIGSTSNEYVRKSLWNSSKTKKYAGDKVNGARKRYGITSFKYEILATIQCSDPQELKIELEKEEAKYIRQYNSIEKGYNMSEGGQGKKGMKLTDEVKRKISDSHFKIPMKVFNSLTKETKIYRSMSEASRILKVSLSYLHGIFVSKTVKTWNNYQISVA
jgi:hypothetical protein